MFLTSNISQSWLSHLKQGQLMPLGWISGDRTEPAESHTKPLLSVAQELWTVLACRTGKSKRLQGSPTYNTKQPHQSLSDKDLGVILLDRWPWEQCSYHHTTETETRTFSRNGEAASRNITGSSNFTARSKLPKIASPVQNTTNIKIIQGNLKSF